MGATSGIVADPVTSRRLADLRAELGRFPIEGIDRSDRILEPLRELLDLERTLVYRVAGCETGYQFDFADWSGYVMPARVAQRFAEVVATTPRSIHSWDPNRVAPFDRDRATSARTRMDPEAYAQLGVVREVYPILGLRDTHDLRVLICDGPKLLAWVGGFRSGPICARELGLLQQLVAPLKAWAMWRVRIHNLATAGLALPAVLEAIATAAFIVSTAGHVAFANEAGRAALAHDRARITEQLRRAVLTGESTDCFEVTRVGAVGVASHVLAIEKRNRDDLDDKLARARRVWKLTARQAEVLGLLARGHTNRMIAESLGCSERTIELHVTALLCRTGVESRTAVVAKLLREL